MSHWVIRGVRVLAWIGLLAAGVAVLLAPLEAPGAVLATLGMACWPLWRAWHEARATALRPAVLWAGGAVGLGMLAQLLAWADPVATGRPLAGFAAYLSALATLAALISVLNARRPGAGAWAMLMGLLALVFLIPWLEAGGLAGPGRSLARLRLESPWTLFFGLLVLAGVANYLPTRAAPAAVLAALALGLEYAGLTRTHWPPSWRARVWSAVPWMLACALWAAQACSKAVRWPRLEPGLERLWLWFRDRWGAVWALRVQERFNRSAELLGWPVRLGWFGVVPANGAENSSVVVPPEADVALRGLLRRFADAERIEAELGRGAEAPCDPARVP